MLSARIERNTSPAAAQLAKCSTTPVEISDPAHAKSMA
jgi:hypothetical protein